MTHHITYDGEKIHWPGHGVFNATSGLPGSQRADQQVTKDAGPIPEGLYFFPVKLGHDARMINKGGNLDTDDGIEHLPAFWDFGGTRFVNIAWGPDRVRLHIVHITHKAAAGRAGFYLHDSTKGFSHGCVEVDGGFFQELRVFEKQKKVHGHGVKLFVRVKYPSPLTSTFGNTLKGP